MAVPTRTGRPAAIQEHHNPLEYKMKRPEIVRNASPEKAGRGSFSSVREHDGDVAQTFTSSKVSSYTRGLEDAIDDTASIDVEMADVDVEFAPPVTQPYSKLHGAWYPAHSFGGWKQISVKGRPKTRSFGDLHSLQMIWNSPPRPNRVPHRYSSGASPLERLPIEILGSIIELLVIELPPPNSTSTRNGDLMALLLGSRTLHAATLNTLYKHITIPHSRIYKKFLANIAAHPALGTIVRRLDFSHFNPGTLFLSESERNQTQNLTAQTLMQCFALTPYLQEFLAQEHVEDDLSRDVLLKLFTGLPRLQAIDLCGCSSPKFRDAFESMLLGPLPETLSITRLSLHKCLSLPSSAFETILPRLASVTHLDLAGTKVTDAALRAIPVTARITHLNLAKCGLLTAGGVIDFLTTHPAVTTSLVFLSVATDARSRQLLDVADVAELLPALPRSLRSLSLKGSKMDGSLVPLLVPLSRHLEELALGRCLSVHQLHDLVLRDERDEATAPRPTLRYLDLSDLTEEEMDLGNLFGSGCPLLGPATAPLEVLEITEGLFARLQKAPAILRRVGWVVKEFGRRAWMVREGQQQQQQTGSSLRAWKMGAESWGMHKVPVARAEVGGMYGSFMFGRKL